MPRSHERVANIPTPADTSSAAPPGPQVPNRTNPLLPARSPTQPVNPEDALQSIAASDTRSPNPSNPPPSTHNASRPTNTDNTLQEVQGALSSPPQEAAPRDVRLPGPLTRRGCQCSGGFGCTSYRNCACIMRGQDCRHQDRYGGRDTCLCYSRYCSNWG